MNTLASHPRDTLHGVRLGPVRRIVGLLTVLYSLTLCAPVVVALLYRGAAAQSFLLSAVIMATAGAVIWFPARRETQDLRTRDGFLVVALTWSVLGLLGALPLYFDRPLGLTYSQAVFETISGLTTTGSTVLVGLDRLPRSILFYRSQLQWVGGMGIILLALAILPMLGIGGMELYRAETPGPVKDKLTPRLANTAKALWTIYVGATAACALALWIAGMSGFDAICHSFATLSTGGFSTHDASIGYFSSPAIEWITIIFMVIGGANFSLHYRVLNKRRFVEYLRDAEFKAYLWTLLAAAACLSGYLYLSGTYRHFGTALTKGTFQVATFATTSGFASANYASWPWAVQGLLIFLTFFVSCAGSTGGGLKMVRFYLIIKEHVRQVATLVHPNAVIPVKLGTTPVTRRVNEAVWAFASTYALLFAILMLALMATGLDPWTAFSSLAATMNDAGPGLGKFAANFGAAGAPSLWIFTVAMLLGRLELFTLLVIFSPAFWRS